MSNRAVFAGQANALDFYYGGPIPNICPPPLTVLTAPANSPIVNPGGVTMESGTVALTDGTNLAPLATTAPILIGSGPNQETVTPASVTNATSPVPGQAGFTANFTQIHGVGDRVASGTCGLQEAINYMQSLGGGEVVVTSTWANAGGTTTMINNAVFASPKIVTVVDRRTS